MIGGHGDSIAGLLRALPPTAREAFAGSFRADPHTLTEARIRELAGPVIGRWVARRERELAEEVLAGPPGHPAAVGLPACLTAVGRGAVDRLLVPDDGMIPGFACDGCGTLDADDRGHQLVTGERVGAGLGGRGGPPPRRAPAAGPRVPPAGRSGRGGRQIRRPLACPGTRTATAWNTATR